MAEENKEEGARNPPAEKPKRERKPKAEKPAAPAAAPAKPKDRLAELEAEVRELATLLSEVLGEPIRSKAAEILKRHGSL